MPEASSSSFCNSYSCPATPASNQPRRQSRTQIVSAPEVGSKCCIGDRATIVSFWIADLVEPLMTSPLGMARDCYCRVAEDSLAANECLLLLANSVEGAVMLHLPYLLARVMSYFTLAQASFARRRRNRCSGFLDIISEYTTQVAINVQLFAWDKESRSHSQHYINAHHANKVPTVDTVACSREQSSKIARCQPRFRREVESFEMLPLFAAAARNACDNSIP